MKQVTILILVAILLIACSTPPAAAPTHSAATVPAATPTTPAVPPTATPTPIPPTGTPAHLIQVTPVDPAALHITYVCKDGFIITAAGKKIMVDALFHDLHDICRKDSDATAQSGLPPFDNADLVLVTHVHWDHFSPELVGSYLQNHPMAVLVAEKAAVEALEANFPAFAQIGKRVNRIELARGSETQMSLSGIDLEIISAPADVTSLGYLIRLGEYTFFHSGDSGLDTKIISEFKAYRLCEKGIDFAFVPFWYFSDPLGTALLQEICGRHYIPMHYAGEGAEGYLTDLNRSDPRTIIFPEEWQAWPP
jgi:L-ascorbate metabolism protein UlaG (beta-lactamase superfamily)